MARKASNKKQKRTVVGKKALSFGGKTKSGKMERSGTLVKFDDGTSKVLLTPSGKGKKFAYELQSGERLTNDGVVKVDDKGRTMGLSSTQRSYRSGYLDAQKDAAKAYKARNGGKK